MSEPATAGRMGPRHRLDTGGGELPEVHSVVTEVRAEITANVWQVPVQVGHAVAEGDELAILESMKMEIPVVAPVSGTVSAVSVAPEDQVVEGDLICTIDADATD